MNIRGYTATSVDFGEPEGTIELFRNGQLIGMVGENASGSVQVSAGFEQCYHENELCGIGRHAMDVTYGADAVSVETGDSVVVNDELLVTNDNLTHLYDSSGGCNFGAAVSYRIGAATVTSP